MQKLIRIGTRDSQLAVWQATLVQNHLKESGVSSELVYIKSEGDIDTVTPLYALGVQGIFTKTLDAALLNNRIDIAVHSMKDVPTQLAKGIQQAAVLKRGSHKDILVFHPEFSKRNTPFTITYDSLTQSGSKTKEESWSISLREHAGKPGMPEDIVIATSSIRRIAQWLNKYPSHKIENLRGNVNTRLRKLKESNWHGAVFAAAGLERINLRPENSMDLDWMLPAPAQGAIMIVCRENDHDSFEFCQALNHDHTALCTKIERDFLNTLMGGCSTPISALAEIKKNKIFFSGNLCSKNGQLESRVSAELPLENAPTLGVRMANQILQQPTASKVLQDIRYEK